MKKKSLTWVILHTLSVIIVSLNLLTGLRISILNAKWLAPLSPILPQGNVLYLHWVSGILLVPVILIFVLFKHSEGTNPSQYHKWVTRLGYTSLVLGLMTGLGMYLALIPPALSHVSHQISAIGLFTYLLLHACAYLIQYGKQAIVHVVTPANLGLSTPLLVFIAIALFCTAFSLFPSRLAHHDLNVLPISIEHEIAIDGHADEAIWKDAKSMSVWTFGGANFAEGKGETQIHIRAMQNGTEAYFFVQWHDPTQSLIHLPLEKRDTGWKVKSQGFSTFDETQYYEDKFAIMLSTQCNSPAAGTAHLGPKPLEDKPANWHGKGYHYASDGVIRDLWHWKAVRTNDMMQADDNYIGAPLPIQPGQKRYTAGYQSDTKESGGYVMNWQWFDADTITPKRLPKSPAMLAPLQKQGGNWVIPWFDYQVYHPSIDTYPKGTLMPSVMYRSNQFEGDRADVRAHAVWKNGQWNLELSRKLDTQSKYDLPIKSGLCLWVSAFDRAQVAHTRHPLPIMLNIEDMG